MVNDQSRRTPLVNESKVARSVENIMTAFKTTINVVMDFVGFARRTFTEKVLSRFHLK
jgi:hypothetical protein